MTMSKQEEAEVESEIETEREAEAYEPYRATGTDALEGETNLLPATVRAYHIDPPPHPDPDPDPVLISLPVTDWRVEQVCHWLNTLTDDANFYTNHFRRHHIAGRQLLSMDVQTLHRMGIKAKKVPTHTLYICTHTYTKYR